jgi:hypothetical protein
LGFTVFGIFGLRMAVESTFEVVYSVDMRFYLLLLLCFSGRFPVFGINVSTVPSSDLLLHSELVIWISF